MTPEQMNEYAERIEDVTLTLGMRKEIAAFLRESAKSEPIYQLCCRESWNDVDKEFFDAHKEDYKARFLYATPQPDSRDERIKVLEVQRDELLTYVDNIAHYSNTELSYEERRIGQGLVAKIEAEKKK